MRCGFSGFMESDHGGFFGALSVGALRQDGIALQSRGFRFPHGGAMGRESRAFIMRGKSPNAGGPVNMVKLGAIGFDPINFGVAFRHREVSSIGEKERLFSFHG